MIGKRIWRMAAAVLAAVVVAWTAGPAAPPAAAKAGSGEALLGSCVANMAKMQSLLEFYFIQAGQYPKTFEELDDQINGKLPDKTYQKVALPQDPATKSPFKYTVSPDRHAYLLSAPDPSKYGLEKLTLTQVDWAGLGRLADEQRREALLEMCIGNIKDLATVAELYNYKYNEYAKDIEQLKRPGATLPTCPVSRKPYGYAVKDGVFEIYCMTPQAHDLGQILYNSNSGPVIKPMQPSSPAPSPSPSSTSTP